MTTKPVTPIQRAAPPDLDASRLDQSDDDSDTKEELRKRYGSMDTSQDKNPDHDAHYTVEANSDYSLFTNPPELGAMRQRLFDIPDGLELSDTEFETYFPFVDNIWRKNRLPDAQRDNEGTSEIYCCRLKPTGQVKTPTPRPVVEGKQQRRKRKREDKTCFMTMKVTYVDGPIRKIKISKIDGSDSKHSHDLDYLDNNKRNSAIMDVARREAHRGFLPGSIFWKMQEEPDKMNEAGGKFMKVSDVRNVQYPWRQSNPTVILKAHSGYSQQRTGPRQRPATGSAPSTPQNGDSKLTKPTEPFVPTPVPQSVPRAQPAPIPQPRPPPPPAPQSALPQGALHLPEEARAFLTPYLPYHAQIAHQQRPHVTLTWATSLDSRIALLPGVQTAISGPETKAMTHYLRSCHDAILIGVKTAISDDPGLNCRFLGAGGFGGIQPRALQPRPIIIDPHAKLQIHQDMRMLKAVQEGKGIGPWIVVGPGTSLPPQAVALLKHYGGEFLRVNEIHPEYGLDWKALLDIFYKEGIRSIMVEGGGKVLSELLNPRYTDHIDSVVMTIAPTFFGKAGVPVVPETTFNGGQPVQTRLQNARWQPMGASDVVLCGHLDKTRMQPRLPGINEIANQHAPLPNAMPTGHGPPPSHAPPAQSAYPAQHTQPSGPAQPPPQQHTPPNSHGSTLQAQNPRPYPNAPIPPHQPHPSHQPHQASQPQQLHHIQPSNPGHPGHARNPSQPQMNGAIPNAPTQQSPRFRQYGPPPPSSARPS